MPRLTAWLAAAVMALGATGRPIGAAQPPEQATTPKPAGVEAKRPLDDEPEEPTVRPLPDPLRGMNRAFFRFNDRLYFWVVRPAANGYRSVVPRDARIGVGKFFNNLAGLRRTLNCLFQGDLSGSGKELARFGFNTTVGILGFTDPAKAWLKLRPTDADFGQTLGVWGMRPVCFLTWPLLGPSSLRDTLALPLDAALDPATFIPGASLIKRINHVSLNPGGYEDLIESALDPYVAIRDAYNQNREHLIRKRRSPDSRPGTGAPAARTP